MDYPTQKMKQDTQRQGEFFIFFQAFIGGIFPVIAIISFNKLSPLFSLGASLLFAALFLAIIISFKKKWSEIKNISALIDILFTTLFIVILYFGLIFLGLHYTSAGNASIISLAEIFTSYIFFHVWKKDPIPSQHLFGAVLMLLGAVIVLYPNVHKFQLGDLLILTATFFPPFGNFFQQRARKKVSSEIIIFARSLIGGIAILSFMPLLKINPFSFDLKNTIFFFIINGCFYLGLSKILWIEGIHRISVTKANALNSTSPIITLLFAWLILKNTPTIWQLLSFIPMFFGIILLGIKTKK